MRRVVRDVAFLMVLAWVGLNVSFLGTSDRLDKYLQDLINTHLGSFIYPHQPSPDITVLLLTDHVIGTQEMGGRWPARYDFHGRVLKAILAQRPKAVFIDFLWLSQRPEASGNGPQDGAFLIRQLENYKKKGVPVYLAGNPAVKKNWADIDHLVTWVSVPLTFHVTDFIARDYAPWFRDTQTAAFRIATDLYPQRFTHPPTETMDIVWGTAENPLNLDWLQGEATNNGALDVLAKGYAGVSMSVPYTTTLFVRDLLNPRDETIEAVDRKLRNYLHDKVVMYGANLEGINDLVFTPARTTLPGVYLHAMALDNLLNWGNGYKSESGATRTNALLSHELLSMLAVFPVAFLCALIHHVSSGRLPETSYRLQRLRACIHWAHSHKFFAVLLVSAGLVCWFGMVAWFEYDRLNYSASVVVGYLQVIALGFFVEKTALLDKAGAAFTTLKARLGMAEESKGET